MRRIDYDTEQYRDYARGRAFSARQLQAWISAFEAVLPERRPLEGLDIGSGTGRFTPALAGAFGPVTGVEPSVRMREVAQARSRHPGGRYLAGCADYALMFLSWHHVQDKPRAVRELARVLRPAGRLLLRANFSDHHLVLRPAQSRRGGGRLSQHRAGRIRRSRRTIARAVRTAAHARTAVKSAAWAADHWPSCTDS